MGYELFRAAMKSFAVAPRADAALFDLLRHQVRLAAPGVPLFTVKTFGQHVDASPQLWIVRTGAVIVSVFAGLALALAVVGARLTGCGCANPAGTENRTR